MCHRLYIAFIDQIVIENQGLLNPCCSLNSRFLINSLMDREEIKQYLKCMFVHFYENCEKYIHMIVMCSFLLLMKKISRQWLINKSYVEERQISLYSTCSLLRCISG